MKFMAFIGILFSLVTPARAGLLTFDISGVFGVVYGLGDPSSRDPVQYTGWMTFDLEVPGIINPWVGSTNYDDGLTALHVETENFVFDLRPGSHSGLVNVWSSPEGDRIGNGLDHQMIGMVGDRTRQYWAVWSFLGHDILRNASIENVRRWREFEIRDLGIFTLGDNREGFPDLYGPITNMVERTEVADATTPEPSTLALAALGLAAWKLRRKTSVSSRARVPGSAQQPRAYT